MQIKVVASEPVRIRRYSSRAVARFDVTVRIGRKSHKGIASLEGDADLSWPSIGWAPAELTGDARTARDAFDNNETKWLQVSDAIFDACCAALGVD